VVSCNETPLKIISFTYISDNSQVNDRHDAVTYCENLHTQCLNFLILLTCIPHPYTIRNMRQLQHTTPKYAPLWS